MGRAAFEEDQYFNPRPPRGGRRTADAEILIGQEFQSTPPARGATIVIQKHRFLPRISIHAPREGGDRELGVENGAFQISIHAPREGGDLRTADGVSPPVGFQSTPPARGATPLQSDSQRTQPFQSTPPARGATAVLPSQRQSPAISIHAPREGGDT